MFEALTNMQGASHQHDFCADCGLDYRDAQRCVSDTLRLCNRYLERDHCRETDVEVGSKDNELPQFLAGFFAERGFRLRNALRCCFRLWESRHREPPIGFVCSECYLTVFFSTISQSQHGGRSGSTTDYKRCPPFPAFPQQKPGHGIIGKVVKEQNRQLRTAARLARSSHE